MSAPALTEPRRKLVVFIGEYTLKHGRCPTLREIRDGAGVSASTNGVYYHLQKLHYSGYLVLGNGKARSITLTEWGKALVPEPEKKFRSVPILTDSGLRVLAARMREKEIPMAWLGGEA